MNKSKKRERIKGGLLWMCLGLKGEDAKRKKEKEGRWNRKEDVGQRKGKKGR